MFTCSRWALLPPAFSSFTAAGLWLVYVIAVHDERIVPLGSEFRGNGSLYPPYISVAGNYPPASCIFSQIMNLAAFVGFIIIVLRYLQLKSRVQAWLNVANLVGFSIGFCGMTLVGNFQLFLENTTHNVGTLMTFGVGTLFCWVESFITLRANIYEEGKKVAVLRFLLSGLITLCMILYKTFQAQNLHPQAAQCQWALVMFFLTFFSVYAIEFRHCRFEAVCMDRHSGPVSVSETPHDVFRYQPEQM